MNSTAILARRPGAARGLTGALLLLALPSGAISVGQDVTPSPPPDSTNMTLRVEWSAREAYVGEPITLTFTWDCRVPLERVKAVDIRIPVLRNRAFREIVPAESPGKSAPDAIGIPVNETRAIGMRQGNQVRFSKTVLPLKEGTYPAAPASLSCAFLPRKSRDAFQYPSYFDNQFFQPVGNVRRAREFARTPPATLRILPLPTAGRPADFSGLVGRCSIATRANPESVQVGDPITLELLVSEHPYPDVVPMPELAKRAAFRNDFQFSGDAQVPMTRDGTRVFRYTIRPRHPMVKEIPSVTLSFFNAESTSYRTAVSAPIPIEVRDAEVANAADAILNDGTRLNNTVRLHVDGIMQYHSNVPELAARRTVWGWRPLATCLLLLLPPFAYVLVRFLTADRRLARRDPAAARARQAYRTYRRRVGQLVTHDTSPSPIHIAACDAALRDYLADRFDLRAGALTFSDIASLLESRGLADGEIQTLHDIMRAHNEMLYGETAPEPRRVPSPGALSRIVARLERLFLLMLLLVPTGTLMASTNSAFSRVSVPDLLRRAEEHMLAAHAADDPERACALYETAAATYEHVLGRGIRNGHLYYNLGNAWYWSGDRGRALLNYRRAELYLPGHPDVVHNIAEVRARARDTVPVPAFARLREYLLFRDARFHRRLRAHLTAFVWSAFWLLMIAALFRSDRRLARAQRLLATVLLALVSSLLVDASLVVNSSDAVILYREVVGRKGNALIYEPAFNTPLHGGTECCVTDVRDDWTQIELANGLTCWVPSGSIGLVRRG